MEENHISPSRKEMKGTSYLWRVFLSYFPLSDTGSCRVDVHVKKDVSVAACKEECRVFEEAAEREPVA